MGAAISDKIVFLAVVRRAGMHRSLVDGLPIRSLNPSAVECKK
jgi:hypothetical protein